MSDFEVPRFLDGMSDTALTRKMGFRSRKPDAMTPAEKLRKWRRVHGNRQATIEFSDEAAAALLYIRQQWGMKSNAEAVRAAVRFLAVLTRQGLTRLPQTIDD